MPPRQAGHRLRFPPIALLAAFWIYLFIRNGFTETDKDPFYVASFTAPIFQFLGPAILFLMGVVCLLEFRRLVLKVMLPVYLLIGGMLLLFILSCVANGQPLLNAFQFLFGYFQYLILVPYTVLCAIDERIDFNRVSRWILTPILIQFAINLGWWLRINPLQNARRAILHNLDWAYGTLLSTTEAAGVGGLLGFYAFYLLVFKPPYARSMPRWRIALIALCGVLMLLWADSKLTYLTLSSALALVSFFTLKTGFIRKLGYTLGGFAFLACAFLGSVYYNYLYNPAYSSTVSFSEDLSYTMYGAVRAINNNPKIQVYYDIIERMPNRLDFPILGGGPGNATSRFAIKAATPLASKYVLPKIDWELRHGNSMLLLPNTGFNALLGDLGWCGVILYYATLMTMLFSVYAGFKQGRFSGAAETWAFVFIAFTTYFIFHSLIEDKLYLGTEVAFIWIMGSLLRVSADPATKGVPT